MVSAKKNWIHSECTSERGFWNLLKSFEAILRLQPSKISDWLVEKNVWRHSATTSERGFWIITEKTIGDIVRLQLSEVFDWLVKKKLRHSEFTSERGFLKKYWKDWRSSEATTMRGLSLVSEKKCMKTFWGYK